MWVFLFLFVGFVVRIGNLVEGLFFSVLRIAMRVRTSLSGCECGVDTYIRTPGYPRRMNPGEKREKWRFFGLKIR